MSEKETQPYHKPTEAQFYHSPTEAKPYHKPIEELTFADRWMFNTVMRDEAICKAFLEALLEKKIRRIQYIDTEKGVEPAYDTHGIRLDVYLEDEANTVYDIEMQNVNTGVLPRRARYYQGSMDMARMEKGLYYSTLPETYIIFVCAFDLFGNNWPIYHVQHVLSKSEGGVCIDAQSAHEAGAQTAYEDGSHLIFLNAKSTVIDEIESADVRDFLRAVNNELAKSSESESPLGREIVRKMDGVKSDQEVRKKYMNTELYLFEEREKARQEGQAEGLAAGVRQANEATARRLKEMRLSAVDISKATGLTAEEVAAL